VTTLLFVGAGRHQRRAIERIRERGVRVVAVDRNEHAPGLLAADVGEVVDFTDVVGVTEVARRHDVDGVLTVSADRAVPVVAAVAEQLGLAGIGTETATRMTHKLAMRDALAAGGLPQPAFAALRSAEDIESALAAVSLPAVLKPVDSGGQRGVFRIGTAEELERDLDAVLAESETGAAMLEEFVEGIELNGIVVARDGEPALVTLSDRLRPPGVGFGVGWIHVYPPSIDDAQLREAGRIACASTRSLGLRDGIAFPQLIAAEDGRVVVVEVAARIPGGQMADLVRHAVGVDLVEVAVRQALGEPVPDEVALPRFSQPLAIRFLTAEPGPLPTGRVASIGDLDPVLAADGVVQADTYLEVGETIRPVRRDGDRRGYVIAVADSGAEALRRAEAAAALLEVEVEVELDADGDADVDTVDVEVSS
jgi:biotin carboxylase